MRNIVLIQRLHQHVQSPVRCVKLRDRETQIVVVNEVIEQKLEEDVIYRILIIASNRYYV